MIKAIETRYAGCRFRSRTEARWAVFFDAIGVRWEFEKEGFELPSGRYLPDFWIPDWNVWFEVKGDYPNSVEVALAEELFSASQQNFAFAVGAPNPNEDNILWWQRENWRPGDQLLLSAWGRITDSRRQDGDFWIGGESTAFRIGPYFVDHDSWPCVHSRTKQGYEAASSARFEFGEHG